MTGATCFFSVAALNSRGDESGFSKETRFRVPGTLNLDVVENLIVPAPPVPLPTISGRASVKAGPGPVGTKAKPGVPLAIQTVGLNLNGERISKSNMA